MNDTLGIIKLTKEEFQHWKVHIEIFAEDENSKDILYGRINLSNAIELLNKINQYSEETPMKIDQTTNEDTINAENIHKKRNRRLFNVLIKSISTAQRTIPPTKIGAETEIGKYNPTAKASDGIPESSSTIAIITPSRTKPHGSSWLKIPLMI